MSPSPTRGTPAHAFLPRSRSFFPATALPPPRLDGAGRLYRQRIPSPAVISNDPSLARRDRTPRRHHQLVGARSLRRTPRARAAPSRASPPPSTPALRRAAPLRRLPAALHSPSTGGGSGPGWPRRRSTNACCSEVNSRRASVVGVGREHVDAQHDVGPLELRRRPEAARGRSSSACISCSRARSARRTRTAAPATRRAARRTGSSRGSRSARRAPRRAPPARAGPARRAEVASSSTHVLRELVGAPSRSRRSARAVSWSVPGRAAEAQVDAARDTAPPACRTARRSPAARGWAA